MDRCGRQARLSARAVLDFDRASWQGAGPCTLPTCPRDNRPGLLANQEFSMRQPMTIKPRNPFMVALIKRRPSTRHKDPKHTANKHGCRRPVNKEEHHE